ncbi:beta-mannosidase-like isoform X2 [Drosophila innubila]|uniref:beta-mannosidase-like isoform X2 n=1 Tax=Drosophila innubila TaxID=198719 RepID=UPI00148C5AED|nr:beta-mannosidase-like isoform X2 [Drosophila innubila]
MLKIINFSVIFLITVQLLQAKKVQVIELTKWSLRDSDSQKPIDVAKIPSGVYTALASKKICGDLLGPGNDVDLRWIANKTWIYSTSFDMADELGHDSLVNLTFHGIDTVAKIWLNGNLLGETENMFVRYSYVVGHLLQVSPKHNQLEVEIFSPLMEANARAKQLEEKGNGAPPSCPQSRGDVECHGNMLRKMQMSFGGDWNPAALSSGLWKPVTIEYYTVAFLREVDVALKRNDTHWTMDCRAFISTPDSESFYVQLVVYSSDLFEEPFILKQQKLSYASSNLEFQIHIPKEKVKLWWPNGYGAQKLYPVSFNLKTYRSEDGPSLSSRTDSQKLLNIGFRTIELVEDEDERGRTFYFRVNGHPIFMKGVNYVPAHTLPELSADSETLQHLLKSAQEANMNMIRVWGGGLYESDTFYSLADSYGLLVWQDMAFTKATYPVTDDLIVSMRVEAAQNAQRISHHASLAMIVTNNEIELYLVKNRSDFGSEAKRLEDEYKLLFMGILSPELNIISRNDFKPRPGPMISTPSMGIAESGKELAKDPQSPHCGDVHFYEDDSPTQTTYPEARFVSEIGFISLPIRSSWLRVLGHNASEESLAALIRQRQHHPKGFIPLLRQIAYDLPFKLQNWEDNIDEFIYFSQVSQAMSTKKAVELFRSRRDNYSTMGALIWQLNDVWIAPTWSCIDFYGNYKLVYLWAKEFLASLSIIATYHEISNHINITITREDYMEDRDTQYNLFINTFLWNDIYPKTAIARAIGLGSNAIDKLNIPLESVLYEKATRSEIFLEILLKDKQERIVAQNYFYPVPIKNIVGIKNPELQLEVQRSNCGTAKPYINSFSLRITVKYPALFVYLELAHQNYSEFRHTFSMNGFTQTMPRQNVHLEIDTDSECIELKPEHIVVKTMNQYMV